MGKINVENNQVFQIVYYKYNNGVDEIWYVYFVENKIVYLYYIFFIMKIYWCN